MPILDFHGMTVKDAEQTVHKLVDDARSCGATYECHFITGQGKIKIALIKMLKSYGFRVFEGTKNPGELKVEIE